MTDPLALVVIDVTVKADALAGRGARAGLIARPGTLIIASVSDRAWLLGRQHDDPQALRADPDVLLVIDAADVTSATSHRRMLGSTSRLTLATAGGNVELSHKSAEDLLYRAGQRALGFSRLAARQGEDRMFGFAVGDGAVRPDVGLLALGGELRLCELPAPGVTDRSRALVRSATDLASAVAQSAVTDQPAGPGASPRQAYQERLVAAFRSGKAKPQAPQEAGGGAGVVTAVLLDERNPPDLRLELTVDGQPLTLTCAASSRAPVRHLVACAIGDAARDAGV